MLHLFMYASLSSHPDCRWLSGGRISVMGVTLNPPYRSEDCEGNGPSVDRIKQIVGFVNHAGLSGLFAYLL